MIIEKNNNKNKNIVINAPGKIMLWHFVWFDSNFNGNEQKATKDKVIQKLRT